MITASQLIELLIIWNDRITLRVLHLNQAASIYRILYFAVNIWNIIFTSLLVSSNAYVLTHLNEENNNYVSIVSLLIIIFQVCLGLVFIIDKTMKPRSISNRCANSAQQYEGLIREIDIQIETYKNLIYEEYLDDEFFNQLMFYSMREQLIIEAEPDFYIRRIYDRKKAGDTIGKLIEMNKN